MGRDFEAFVHFLGPDGKMAFQNDHTPPTPTSIWSGRVEYTKGILAPIDVPDGDYRIILGLYDHRAANRGWDRPALKTGEGVTAEKGRGADSANSYQIGVLKVDSKAPLPQLPAPTLNLDGYTMTFSDEFDDLSVSAAGPGTRWFTKTKENFGDARFMDQKDGFPFSVEKGNLRIEAAKKNGTWCAGIMASVDPKGQGFSQKFGYFEMRTKFPKSRGMWPAFWLLGQPSITDKTIANIEIDVVEHYGLMPNAIHANLHVWHPDGKHWAKGDFLAAPGLQFITLRRRSAKMLGEIARKPASAWRRVELEGVSRAYRTPRILDQRITLKDYGGLLRQLVVTDLGHEAPTILITNQLRRSAAKLIGRYAQRMLIENGIEDGIGFFHMDALSSAVAMKVNCDLQLTLMASSLYRLLGSRHGNGYEKAKSRHLFRDFIDATATVMISEREIVVRFQKRAHNPLLLAADFDRTDIKVPWLCRKRLQLVFG